jgi:methionyl aminopeptidase
VVWLGLKNAAHVARLTLDALSARVRPGITTGELDEPMVSAGSAAVHQDLDGWTLRTADGALSSHHEHTLLITRDAPIVLTDAAA